MKRVSAAAALTAAIAWSGAAHAATEIQFWHAMQGANNDMIEELAKEFNASQTQYKVVPVYKGEYNDTLNAGIAAFRAHKAPDILQVFDAGTGTMVAARGAIVPIEKVMKDAHVPFKISDYLPGIVSYYSTAKGELLSFPFNSSSPILYYNKKEFQAAGLDPSTPPKTWPEVFADAKKLKASGAAKCGLTSTWMTWIQLENFSAWNNVPYATLDNGLGGIHPKLVFDSPVFVKHFQEFADLEKAGVFSYGGRQSQAKAKFISGECAMMTESSGGIGDVVNAKLDFGTGPMPYYPNLKGAPQNTIPGGASLWVMAGEPKSHYPGIAKFFQFLSRTDVQVKLHEITGYLPATKAAYAAAKKDGFYQKNPGRETPILQMIGKPPTDNSRGVRLVNLPQVRDIEDNEIEAMLAGKEDAKTALTNAVTKGNAAIAEAVKALN